MMRPTSIVYAGLASLALALPATAQDITISDAFARSSGPMAKAGAAFMVVTNSADVADRLVDARSDAAMRVELHTHRANADGVMQMLHVEEGFEIPANGSHALARGGDHVMLMGLTGPMNDGESIEITLVFENAGEMVVDIPIDLSR